MTPDGLQSLALVSRYLAESVVPAVPRAMTAELRAVIKLLDTAQVELGSLFPVLHDECRELLLLNEAVDSLLSPAASIALTTLHEQFKHGCADLPALMATHRRILERTSERLCSLQALAALNPAPEPHELLQRIYTVLGRQAETRLPWQAVFPSTSAWSATNAVEDAVTTKPTIEQGNRT